MLERSNPWDQAYRQYRHQRLLMAQHQYPRRDNLAFVASPKGVSWLAGWSSTTSTTSGTSPGLAPHLRTHHGSRLARRSLFRLVLVEHGTRGGGPLLCEFVAMFRAPVERFRAREIVVREMRRHVARIKFIGTLRRLPVRPVVRQEQEPAELALLRPQAFEQSDRVVRRTDDAELVLDDHSAAYSPILTMNRGWLSCK